MFLFLHLYIFSTLVFFSTRVVFPGWGVCLPRFGLAFSCFHVFSWGFVFYLFFLVFHAGLGPGVAVHAWVRVFPVGLVGYGRVHVSWSGLMGWAGRGRHALDAPDTIGVSFFPDVPDMPLAWLTRSAAADKTNTI